MIINEGDKKLHFCYFTLRSMQPILINCTIQKTQNLEPFFIKPAKVVVNVNSVLRKNLVNLICGEMRTLGLSELDETSSAVKLGHHSGKAVLGVRRDPMGCRDVARLHLYSQVLDN